MKKFPSIDQLRNVVKQVRLNHDYKGSDDLGNPKYQHDTLYPTLKFKGTVKLHGTNAGIVRYLDGHTEYQSRERVLTLESDNAGFMAAMSQKNLGFLFDRFSFQDYCAIYGEWCGGSIQKGVALNGLEKMFVIFGIKIDDQWEELDETLHGEGIYNILQFPTYEVDIDFENPEMIQNELIRMTIEVEDCCPVGKYFGVEGVGEGIVFTHGDLRFKSKGEKHSVSKVKTLNPVNIEQLESINQFVEMAVPEQRLEQGISFLKENNIEAESKNVGEFLRWVVTDVLKEEGDTMAENNLDEKKVKAAIVNKARTWYFTNMLKNV